MYGRPWRWVLVAVVLGGAFPGTLPVRAAESRDALSPGARKLLGGLQWTRPVWIEAFVSPVVPEAYDKARQSLTGILQELETLAPEKVKVRIHGTRPLSDEALRAEQLFGIGPRKVTTPTPTGYRVDFLFLGVAIRCGYEQVVLPFVDSGVRAEYELVRTLDTFARQRRKTVGVLATDAGILGGAGRETAPHVVSWPIVEELKKHYRVVGVDPSGPMRRKCDVLLAVQPSSLGPEEMKHFVAAVRSGQPTAVFEDPCPVFAQRVPATSQPRYPPAGMNPMMMMKGQPGQPKGDIARLWDLLGVDFSADKVVWQDYNPYPTIAWFGRQKELVFVGRGSGAEQPFNDENEITSKLRNVLFPFPGAISKLHASDREFDELVRTSDRTGTARYRDLVHTNPFGPPMLRDDPRRRRTSDTYVLAAQIRGKLPNEVPTAAEDEEKTGKEKGEKAPQPGINVVLVADIDMLTPSFFALREQGEIEEFGISLDFDNLPFVFNIVDSLAGEQRFLELRRQRSARTAPRRPALSPAQEAVQERIRKLRKQLDEALEKEKKALEQKIEALKKRKDVDPQQAAIELALVQRDGQRRVDSLKERVQHKRDQIASFGHLAASAETGPPEPGKPWGKIAAPGERLFPDFNNLKAVARLEWTRHDPGAKSPDAFRLVRREGRWVIQDREDYPADVARRVADVTAGLAGLKIAAVADAVPADLATYGVVDPAREPSELGPRGIGTRVTLKDEQGAVLLSLVVGREVPDRAGSRYVRRADGDAVYTVAIKPGLLAMDPRGWIDEQVVRIDPSDLVRIRIRDYSVDEAKGVLLQRGEATLRHDQTAAKDAKKWALLEKKEFRDGKWVPVKTAGQEDLDEAKLDAMKGALASLAVVDVVRKPAKMSSALKEGKLVFEDRQTVTSLMSKGFYAARLGEKMELLANEGELLCLTREGVQLALRFGAVAGGGTLPGRGPGRPAAAAPGRFLLVTAEFKPETIDKSGLEPGQYDVMIQAGRRRANELNARFADWYYVLSDEVFQKIHVRCEEITRKKD